jgi:hypothetical protein
LIPPPVDGVYFHIGVPHRGIFVSGVNLFRVRNKNKPRGNRNSNFRQGVRGRGAPGRAEKNFYLYISRERKEPLKHVSEPLGTQVHCWELKQRAVAS